LAARASDQILFALDPEIKLMTSLPRRLSVQQVMQDIERAQLKGDAGEEELRALEIDVTGKILLASWRGTRFEVVQVLREVRPCTTTCVIALTHRMGRS
jgi:hypothetical protein